MPNMSLKKTSISVQDPLKRNKNFKEVCLGYSEEEAITEANRCLNCKNKPCKEKCPVKIDIPDFIAQIREKNYSKAYAIINKSSSLAAVCGRVCPQETQCESSCIRKIKGESVAIGKLERFVADWHNENEKEFLKPTQKNIKIAIIGSGPSGISCAADLAKEGFRVTIFEALHAPGGVLTYGIPEFRLPKRIVEKEVSNLKKLGVEIITNVVVGSSITIDELKEKGFYAIFIASGAGLPKFMNIEGENLNGVYSANEFLTRINLMKAYEQNSQTPIYKPNKVAVVGGGNVAIDAARSAKRLGADEVYIIYRRSEKEMPARVEEIEHAKEEGIILKLLSNPVKIYGNENFFVEKIECVEMELSEPDESGRKRPIEKKSSNFFLEVDSVIMAIGTSPNPLIKNTTPGLKTTDWGGILIDEKTALTSKENVYAGGDAVTGAATVILAMAAGKKAAKSIIEKIKSENIKF